MAAGAGIVRAGDHIVVVHMVHQDFLVKIVDCGRFGREHRRHPAQVPAEHCQGELTLTPGCGVATPGMLRSGHAHLLRMQRSGRAMDISKGLGDG